MEEQHSSVPNAKHSLIEDTKLRTLIFSIQSTRVKYEKALGLVKLQPIPQWENVLYQRDLLEDKLKELVDYVKEVIK